MAALRSVIHGLWMLVTVVPWAIMMLLASLGVSSVRMYWLAVGWLKIAIYGLRTLCGVKWRVTGMENLPVGTTAPAILLVKHQSTLETFLMPILMPHPLAYVFKRELLYVPFFGWAMARLDMIHIDRSQRAQAFNKVVEQGKRLLAQGIWIIMFPEGTRIPRGQAGNYKSGGTRLAVETGAVVVPIALNSGECWPKNSFIKKPGTVTVSVGKPISSEGKTPDELMEQVEQWIESEMRVISPHAYSAG